MRQREDFKEGTLGANLLTTVTTIDFGSDPGFATIAAPDYATIIIDPEGAGNGPEIVYLTAFTATQTTGTITRGEEGTSDPGLTHASGAAWRHGPTVEDFDRFPWAIEAQDLTAAANADVDISGFESVEIIGWMKPGTDGATLRFRLSNDGGASFEAGATDYQWANVYGGNVHGAYYDYSDSSGRLSMNSVGGAAGEFVSFKLKVVGAGSAGVKTTIIGEVTVIDTGAAFYLVSGAVIYNTEEVNDYLRIFFSAGTIATGRIAVYGYPTP